MWQLKKKLICKHTKMFQNIFVCLQISFFFQLSHGISCDEHVRFCVILHETLHEISCESLEKSWCLNRDFHVNLYEKSYDIQIYRVSLVFPKNTRCQHTSFHTSEFKSIELCLRGVLFAWISVIAGYGALWRHILLMLFMTHWFPVLDLEQSEQLIATIEISVSL